MSDGAARAPGPERPHEQPEAIAGWRAREVEQELPSLRLLVAEIQVGRSGPLTGSSPGDIMARLRELSSRFRGARAIGLRREAVTAAYRAFFRQIGLDPEIERTPMEAAVLERMLRGGFLSGGLLEDVLLIALLDTSVPVWALDADRLDGPLGIRVSLDGERLGRSPDAPPLPPGQLLVADASGAVAVLFGELSPELAPGPRSRRLAAYAVQVAGVPTLYVEESLWAARVALERL
jgi:DNA/RNA-binding domain of Phe-tRNA-synthetase-like protein